MLYGCCNTTRCISIRTYDIIPKYSRCNVFERIVKHFLRVRPRIIYDRNTRYFIMTRTTTIIIYSGEFITLKNVKKTKQITVRRGMYITVMQYLFT